MKQKTMELFRRGTRASLTLASAFLLLSGTAAKAQVIVGASFADNVLATSVNALNVNADMVYHGGGGHLRAIVYDDISTATGYIHLDDYSGGSVVIAIPGGYYPDIVIGDDLGSPGNDYIVGVVYGASITRFETYSVTGTGSGTLTATMTSSQQISITGSATSRYPHIDLYPDINNWIVGFPSLHEFVITWSEALTGSPGMDVFATTGDLMSPLALSPYYAITTGGTGMMSDVAALIDKPSVQPYAYIPFFNTSTNDLDIAEIDIAAASFTVTTGVDNPISSLPRIDAMSLYDPSFGIEHYQVAYSKYNGTDYEMWEYNDYSGPLDLSSTGFSGSNNLGPAVAAGPGPLYFMPDYGNDNYTVGWYNTATQEFPVQSIDPLTGNISGTFPDYYIANLNTVTPPAVASPLAVSTATNNGSRLLTAWSGNGRVWYKYNSNTASYKTNGIEEMPRNEQYALYPNPATTELHIAGAKKAAYTITDMTGRTLLAGNVDDKNETIDINGLSAGLYVAAIQEGGVTTLIKFTKQ